MQFLSSVKSCVCTAFSRFCSPLAVEFCCFIYLFVFFIMTARQTSNSLAAALSAIVASSAPVSSAAMSWTSSSIMSSLPGEPVVVSSPMVGTASMANMLPSVSNAVLSPDLVALINQAVQVAIQASQRHPEPVIVSSTPSSGTGSSSASLSSLASSFPAAGTGFQPSISSSSTPGRTIPLVVPTCVSAFNVSVPVLVSSLAHAFNGVSAQLP